MTLNWLQEAMQKYSFEIVFKKGPEIKEMIKELMTAGNVWY